LTLKNFKIKFLFNTFSKDCEQEMSQTEEYKEGLKQLLEAEKMLEM
jgi:hypothetical protein